MSLRADPLNELLPAIYRTRDRDGALAALLEVLGEQADAVAQDVDRLYDNWFIETCDPWVIPYIGDLLGVRALAWPRELSDEAAPIVARALTSRGYVANTIAYRRRKGTLAVIEQLALDVTGWRAHAVEGIATLATTQYLNHVRRAPGGTADLRRATIEPSLSGPFGRGPHTADVRSIAPARAGVRTGRHNIPNVSVFLWRLQSYCVPGSTPRPAAAAGCFTFDPLGGDVRLFDVPRTERAITHLSTERDLPEPLRRLALADELEARRQAHVDGRPHDARWFNEDPPLHVLVRAGDAPAPFEPVPPEQIAICDLSAWQQPAASRAYRKTASGEDVDLPIQVAVDPELGRLAFAAGEEPDAVRVDYAYGFGADVGGGPYDRRAALAKWLGPTSVAGMFHVGVTNRPEILAEASEPELLVTTLTEALARWRAYAAANDNAFGLITMMDSGSYAEDVTVEIPQGARLAVVAANWPDLLPLGATSAAEERRRPGLISADAPLRPHLMGSLSVQGRVDDDPDSPGKLVISGLLIEGGVTVEGGSLGALVVLDSTLPPATASLTVQQSAAGTNGMLRLTLARSITGAIELPDSVGSLQARDSILDAGAGVAVDAPGAHLQLTRCTVFGGTRARTVEISDCIHTAGMLATLLQEGCVRYSALPDHPDSRAPRRYRCQPDLGIAGLKDPLLIQRRRAELKPAFTSVRYGEPGYAQLSTTCAREIQTGGEDDAAMGAFSVLREAQRVANLRSALDEYLPFGLEAGIFFIT